MDQSRKDSRAYHSSPWWVQVLLLRSVNEVLLLCRTGPHYGFLIVFGGEVFGPAWGHDSIGVPLPTNVLVLHKVPT